MRKILCTLIALMLLLSLAVPVLAVSDKIRFTSGSKAEVGGYLEIDTDAMFLNANSSEVYNAMLEGNYEIYWYRDGAFYSTQKRVSFTDKDAGATYSVEMRFYGDRACTVLWATVESEGFTIQSKEPPMEIKTKTVSDGAVGMYYSFQFESSDKNAKYSLYRTSAPDGLTLDSSGYLSGVPTKAGTYHFTVVASGKGGEDMRDYTMQIGGEMFVTKIITESLPSATVGAAYDITLECSDPNASFGIYYNPGKSNEFDGTGLKMADNGRIFGTPTKAGTYTFWVGAYGTSEDHYKEFTLTVLSAPTTPAPTTPETAEPEVTVPTETTEAESGGKKPTGNKGDKDSNVNPGAKPGKEDTQEQVPTTGKQESNGVSMPWWTIAMIGGGCLVLGAVVALAATRGKKR